MHRPDNILDDILGDIIGQTGLPLSDEEVEELVRHWTDTLTNEELDAVVRHWTDTLTDEEVDVVLSSYGWGPAMGLFQPDDAGLPDRYEVERWMRKYVRTGDQVWAGPYQLSGTTVREKVAALYKVLTKYSDSIHEFGEPIELRVQAVHELVYPREHPEGPGHVASHEKGTLLCFLKEVAKRWPALEALCAELNVKWSDGKLVTAERIKELVTRAGGRADGYHHTIGVELLDRMKRPWWSYNTTKKNGERREDKRIITLITGCHHVEPKSMADFNGEVVDLPEEVFKESMHEGRWASIVHEDAFLHEGVLFRNEAFVQELLDRAGTNATVKSQLNYDFRAAFEQAPFCRSVQGVTASLFRKACGLEGLEKSALRDYLDSTQVEHCAVEFTPVKATDVEYDLNSCFASYRQCWYTDLYRRYGLPHVPTMGGWLPLDITEEEQDALLWQTGFALVEDVVPHHWSLKQFPYLISGRGYPTVWLRHIKENGGATFRLRHIMLSSKFFEEGDIAGGDVMRKVIGKWQQRYTRDRFYAGDRDEAERLVWENVDRLRGFEPSGKGFMVEFESEAGTRYPHLRSYVLAYSHIAMFHKLYQMAEPPVAVKTDAIILRDRDPKLFKEGLDIVWEEPGRWKVSSDAKRGVNKVKSGEVVPLKSEKYGTSRLVKGWELRLEDRPLPPGANDIGFLLRGDAERGVNPISWETAWRFDPVAERQWPRIPDLEDLVSGVRHVPLTVCLRGPGGFGKTTWAASVYKELSWDNSVAVTAFQNDTVDDELSKFNNEVPGATLHSWLYPADDRMKAMAQKVMGSDIIIVDEASQISADLFERLERKAASRCIILAGDEAQTAPVVPKAPRMQYGPFKERTAMAHTIEFTKDWRSSDADTAALKDRVRNLRLADCGDTPQLQAILDAGVRSLRSIEDLEKTFQGRSADDLANRLLVICGKRETRARVNTAIRKAAFGKKRPPKEAPIPLRCCKTYKEGNAGERRVLPWKDAQRLLMTKCWEWGYASTVHSVQGKTIEEPVQVVYIADWMCPGLVYTAVSRVRSKGQLTIVGASEHCDQDYGNPDYDDY